MSVTPRPYQLRAEEQIRDAWKGGARRILAVLPTGAGKTTVMSRLVHAATVGGKGRRAVVCAHRAELVDQLSRRLHLHDVPHGVVQAGRRGRGDAPVQVCSVQTLTARGQAPEGDLLIFDEAHHVAAATWGSILAAYPRAEAVIGFTATPERGDGRGLGDAFQTMVSPVDVPELIEGGYLLPSDVWAPSAAQKQLAADPVEIWHRLARGRRGVVFASTVKQAHELAEAFTRSGVRAAALDGKTGDEERRDILGNLGRGALDIVCNVAVLTEGFDCPGLDVVMSAGGISSASAWIQKVGRGKRPKNGTAAPGDRGLVIDLRGAVWEHGHPDEARTYSLAGKAISLGVERLPLRQCKSCGAVERAGASRECGRCGARLPPPPAPKLSRAELAQIEAEKIALRRATPGTGARWEAWVSIVKRARANGQTGLPLKMEFRSRFNHFPPWGEEAVS